MARIEIDGQQPRTAEARDARLTLDTLATEIDKVFCSAPRPARVPRDRCHGRGFIESEFR